MCHTVGRTKPCIEWMTGGELTCEICSPLNQTEMKGYQPLIRESDGRPCMVVVSEHSRDQMDALKWGSRVIVGREAEASDSVWITNNPSPEPRFHSTLKELLSPADLTETLLRVWKIPDLVTWYRQTHGTVPTETPASPKLEPKKSNGKPFSPALKKAAEVAQQIGDDMLAGDSSDAVIRRLKAHAAVNKPSTNGDH